MAKFTKVQIANRRKGELKNNEVVWPTQVRALGIKSLVQIQISAELILFLPPEFRSLAHFKEPLNLKSYFLGQCLIKTLNYTEKIIIIIIYLIV